MLRIIIVFIIVFLTSIKGWSQFKPQNPTDCHCLPGNQYIDGVTYFDVNTNPTCKTTRTFNAGFGTFEFPCDPMYYNVYEWQHGTTLGLDCGPTYDVHASVGSDVLQIGVDESKNDIGFGISTEATFTATITMVNPLYSGKFDISYTATGCGNGNTEKEIICVLKKANTTFGNALVQEGQTILTTTGSSTIHFSWQGDPSYCNEVFTHSSTSVNGLLNMKVEEVGGNGLGTNGWVQTNNSTNNQNVFGAASVNVNGFGIHHFMLSMMDKFGNIYQTQLYDVNLVPSCSSDGPPQISLVNSGGGAIDLIGGGYSSTGSNGGYKLEANKEYTINMAVNVSNYCTYYETMTDDGSLATVAGSSSCTDNTCVVNNALGANHIQFISTGIPGTYKFTILDGMGSYRIYAAKKSCLGGQCQTFNPINIFVGGMDLNGYSPCLIYLPRDLFTIFPDLEGVKSQFGQSYIFQHFTYVVSSAQGIIVQDGMILQNGAILKIDTEYHQPTAEAVDNIKNWVQDRVFDDKGQVIAESKQFFNNKAKATQVQVKNLSAGVVMAAETVYDKYDRPFINTLSAPVREGGYTDAVAQCGPNTLNGTNMYFIYKPDFTSGYQYTDFDDFDGATFSDTNNYTIGQPVSSSNENNPDPVNSINVGTLGWYYGSGNVSNATTNLKEPLVAATSYPYSRTLVYPDGSSEFKSSTIPGDAFKAGGNYVPVQQIQRLFFAQDAPNSGDNSILNKYLTIRNTYVFPGSTVSVNYLDGTVYKRSSTDVEGRETDYFYGKEDQLLITIDVSSGDKAFQYYDAAGRLVCSISPNGVNQLLTGGQSYSTIDKTTFKFNQRGWLLQVNELDGGTRNFMYRKDGSIRFSQNAEQVATGKFSYANYDRIGRPIETGEYTPDANSSMTFNSSALKAILEDITSSGGLSSGTRTDQILTHYDQADVNVLAPQGAAFLVGKVSYIERIGVSKTWYSYDERGRVIWTEQDIPVLGRKRIEYLYNPQGNVRQVAYNPTQPDQFYHVYNYDTDGRLNKVYTGQQTPVYDDLQQVQVQGDLTEQADYNYYLHGPLKRVELGGNLQGVDYVYTAQGWLKSINSHDTSKDPGGDGNDVFGMTLNYYSGDYLPKYGQPSTTITNKTTPDFHNGNIQSLAWYTKKPTGSTDPATAVAYQYNYDSKDQLLSANWGSVNATSAFVSAGNAFMETNMSYDANGNLKSLKRYDAVGGTLHDFTKYRYENKNGNSNQLTGIDGYNASYQYNTIGQMVSQTKGSTTAYVQYDVRGMTTSWSQSADGTLPTQKSYYDEQGLCYKREQYNNTSHQLGQTTYYVHDASGNTLTVYIQQTSDPVPVLQEYNVYGTERIGQYQLEGNNFVTTYELKDHLGSVRALVWKNSVINQLDVLSYYDYYPYGLNQRGYNQNMSRYQYQGENSEYDPNTKVNHFELRDYDPIVGRWFGLDPYRQYYSPYAAMGNNPISFVDPDGGGTNPVEGSTAEHEGINYVYKGGEWEGSFSVNVIGSRPGVTPSIIPMTWMFQSYPRVSNDPQYTAFGEGSALAADIVNTFMLAEGIANLGMEGALYLSTRFAAKTGGNAFRYMTEAELKAVQNTGLLRGGRAGETFFTKDLYKSATSAQNRLALPTSPKLRVEFQIINNPALLRNGTKVLPANGMMGKGTEFMTLDAVKVKLINWQPLR